MPAFSNSSGLMSEKLRFRRLTVGVTVKTKLCFQIHSACRGHCFNKSTNQVDITSRKKHKKNVVLHAMFKNKDLKQINTENVITLYTR